MLTSVITATGSYIPDTIIPNDYFLNNAFYERDGSKITKSNPILIKKLREISGITERRYVKPEQKTSDIAYLSAKDALESSGIDKESLDYIIVAHNFGDIEDGTNRVSLVPSVASRVKFLLQIKNPDCVAYDLPFGCPGWVEALIQANYFIRSGDAKRCLVIGADVISRVLDPHDRDSMLFGDGSGAVIVEASSGNSAGVIGHKTQTFADEDNTLIEMGRSSNAAHMPKEDVMVKMNGRRVYEFALSRVPALVADLLEKTETSILDVSKILIHQANEKMNQAIMERLFRIYGIDTVPQGVMPMSISWLGNSSVATVPTLLDLIVKGKIKGHEILRGEKVVFASVGAGMNINAVLYQF